MPTAEAQLPTSRADRYVAQLCDHLGHMQEDVGAHAHGGGTHGPPPAVRGIHRDDSHARIEFDWGRCVLTASSDLLTVRVEAEDAPALAVGQELLARRIETSAVATG